MKRKARKAKTMYVEPLPAALATVKLHPAITKYSGYCFVKAAATMKSRFDARFQQFGLVGPQYGMLIILKEERQITQNELGTYLAIDKATMVRLIDHLEEKKLLTRTQSQEDRRANHLQITKAGEQIISKLDEERKACEDEFFAPLSKAEREQLVAIIHKLIPAAGK